MQYFMGLEQKSLFYGTGTKVINCLPTAEYQGHSFLEKLDQNPSPVQGHCTAQRQNDTIGLDGIWTTHPSLIRRPARPPNTLFMLENKRNDDNRILKTTIMDTVHSNRHILSIFDHHHYHHHHHRCQQQQDVTDEKRRRLPLGHFLDELHKRREGGEKKSVRVHGASVAGESHIYICCIQKTLESIL